MYLLQRRDDELRRVIPSKDKKYGYNVPIGLAGQYMEFSNTRTVDGVHDHRRAFYSRWVKAEKEDKRLKALRGEGNLGWDDDLRRDVRAQIKFLENPIHVNILGVQIDTDGKEIFYNDELAQLLDEFENLPNTADPKFASLTSLEVARLNGFSAMRETLRDFDRSLNTVYDIDPLAEEVFTGAEQKKDLMLNTLYDIAGAKDKDALLKSFNLPPFLSLSEFDLTPKELFDMIKEWGHRYQAAQFYPTMYKFYLLTNLILFMRLQQIEIPSSQTLAELKDPTGKTLMGVWGGEFFDVQQEIYDILKNDEDDEGGKIYQSYMEKMTEMDLKFIDAGFYSIYYYIYLFSRQVRRNFQKNRFLCRNPINS